MQPSVPHPPDPELERLREDYLKQLLDRHETRSKGFRKLLFSFVGFGMLFLLLVQFPFIRLHRERHQVSDRLNDLGRRSGELDLSLAGYQKAADGFETLRKAIDGGAYELRDALRFLADAPSPGFSENAPNAMAQQMIAPQSQMQQRQGERQQQQQQQQQLGDPCGSVTDREVRMNCRVAEQVRGQFQRYDDVLENSVLGPIRALPTTAGVKPDTGMLRRGLDSIRVAFEARLSATPRFWERFGGKLDFFGELRGNVDGFWRRFGFEAQKAALETARRGVDSLKTDLEGRQELLEKQEEALAVRLAQIDSPLGKLPVGLLEAVQLFPLLMAIGFVWCSSVLLELVAIRRALYQGYRRRDPEQAALTDRQLNLIAPLWIDPGETRAQDAGAHVVLLAPIVIYLVGCVLVAYHWIGLTGSEASAGLDRWLYGTLYVIAGIGLYVAWRRVQDVARNVRSEQAAPAR